MFKTMMARLMGRDNSTIADVLEQGTVNALATTQVDSSGGIVNGQYEIMVDEVDANNTYIGEAIPGTLESEAEWRIYKVTVSGTVTKTRFADAVTTFTKEWDERATYDYTP